MAREHYSFCIQAWSLLGIGTLWAVAVQQLDFGSFLTACKLHGILQKKVGSNHLIQCGWISVKGGRKNSSLNLWNYSPVPSLVVAWILTPDHKCCRWWWLVCLHRLVSWKEPPIISCFSLQSFRSTCVWDSCLLSLPGILKAMYYQDMQSLICLTTLQLWRVHLRALSSG